ncbi:hypothetical protein AB0940_33495 [Streptomyces sp. NPDC006656]|uniref:hypothetical protein n=1 Tax=Streptomyces sp. NPDC006656 TaxID=3156899 RepID=UPI0034517828
MRYLEGVCLDAFARGNRRLLAPVLAWAKEPVPVPTPKPAPAPQKAATAAEEAEGEQPKAKAKEKAKAAPPAEPTRPRVGWRHLGYTAVGGVFLWPLVGEWVPYVVTTAPVLWSVAALVVGQQQDSEEEVTGEPEYLDGDDDQETPQQQRPAVERLFDHVLADLAAAERAYEGKTAARIHVSTLRASALAAGLVLDTTTDKEFGAWLTRCGLAVRQVRVAGVKSPADGLKLETVREVLGASPAEALAARLAAPAPAAVTTPASSPAEGLSGTHPVPALRVLAGGRSGADPATSLTAPQESLSEAL